MQLTCKGCVLVHVFLRYVLLYRNFLRDVLPCEFRATQKDRWYIQKMDDVQKVLFFSVCQDIVFFVFYCSETYVFYDIVQCVYHVGYIAVLLCTYIKCVYRLS